MLYQYLIGLDFAAVAAMFEAFAAMHEDLLAEKKGIQKQWAKPETQIERMIGATTGTLGFAGDSWAESWGGRRTGVGSRRAPVGLIKPAAETAIS